MLKGLIFDFDGVILESVDIKGEAFRELFCAYPEHLKEILAYHYANGGVPRFDKFRYIYGNILNKHLSEEEFRSLCDRFAAFSYQKVLEAPFVPGAEQLLTECAGKYDLYIVSGTPDEEINKIVDGRGLRVFFKGVYGSPKDKKYWTGRILKEGRYLPEQVLWVGDALSDWEAAKGFGIRFVGRVSARADIFQGRDVDWKVEDMISVGAVVKKL